MTASILSDYLAEIARIRATRAGTGEMSYYGALVGALNAAGAKQRPHVFCVPNLRNRGAGYPDMGLFVTGRGSAPEDWPEGQMPERGAVEVDDIPTPLAVKLGSRQVHDAKGYRRLCTFISGSGQSIRCCVRLADSARPPRP